MRRLGTSGRGSDDTPRIAVLIVLASVLGCSSGSPGGDDDDDDADGTGLDGSCPSLECPAGMVPVPCGPFVMGSDPGEGEPDEEPEHEVWLSSFCIDRTEVTAAEWDECVHGGACPRRCDGIFCGGEDQPVHYDVTHERAAAYCRWAGKTLPTEAQWEKAARGGCEIVAPEACGSEDERTYPWGDAPPTPALAVFCDGHPFDPETCTGMLDVGMCPAGAGPYGTLDMAGNVAEWVADRYAPGYAACAAGCSDPAGPASGGEWVVRGGDDNAGPLDLRVSRRASATGSRGVGFRCVHRPAGR